MKKSLRIGIITFLIIICFSSLITKTYQINLSFDSLFPMTWYQKGLESSLFVWQTLINFFEKGNDRVVLSFDLLLARLAFAQFCIKRMYQENNMQKADDMTYFVKVLNKVQKLLGMMMVTSGNYDFILCAEDMLQVMHKQLEAAR